MPFDKSRFFTFSTNLKTSLGEILFSDIKFKALFMFK